MPFLTITNNTTNKVAINQHAITLAPQETRRVNTTVDELELSRDTLVALTTAGIITWSYRTTDTVVDDNAEFITIDGLGAPAAFSSATAESRTLEVNVTPGYIGLTAADLSEINLIRCTTVSGATIEGIAAGTQGRILYLVNVGVDDITLVNMSGLVAVNDMILPPGFANVVIPPNGGATLMHTAPYNQWLTLSLAN